MSRTRLLTVALSLIVLSGCASKLRTEVIASPLHDVTTKKTWSWESDRPLQLMGVLVGNSGDRVLVAMQGEARPRLEKLGYRYVERDQNPDLLATLMLGVSDSSETSYQQTQRSRLNYRPVFLWSQTNEFLQGGAAVLLKDPADGEIVWQGAAIDKLDESNIRSMGPDTARYLVKTVLELLPASAP